MDIFKICFYQSALIRLNFQEIINQNLLENIIKSEKTSTDENILKAIQMIWENSCNKDNEKQGTKSKKTKDINSLKVI